jgi:hypothetical protein
MVGYEGIEAEGVALPVDWVDADGVVAHEDLVGAGGGDGSPLDDEVGFG